MARGIGRRSEPFLVLISGHLAIPCPSGKSPIATAGYPLDSGLGLHHLPCSASFGSCSCALISTPGTFLGTVGELRNIFIIHKTKKYKTEKKVCCVAEQQITIPHKERTRPSVKGGQTTHKENKEAVFRH